MKKINVFEMIEERLNLKKEDKFSNADYCGLGYYVKDEDTQNFYAVTGIEFLDQKIYFDSDRNFIYYDKTVEIYKQEND